MRLKCYKSKYTHAKAFSEKTGSGLSAKNVADGIHTMEDLLESMCPCYSDMDALFGEKGNVTPFGILDSGVGPIEAFEDGSDGETSDGHNHSLDQYLDLAQRIHDTQEAFIQDPQEIKEFTEIFETRFDEEDATHEDDIIKSRPPTPKTFDAPNSVGTLTSVIPSNSMNPSSTGARLKKPAHQMSNTSPALQPANKKPSNVYARRVDALTEQERALNSSSDDNATTTTVAQANQEASGRKAVRSTLSRRPVDPLLSIDPAHVHGKEHKHALGIAIQQGNKAKLDLLNKANNWRQEMETSCLAAESKACQPTLTWDKEKYFLERQDQCEAEDRRLAQEALKERKAFCERLVLEGKTPQELDAFLHLVYPSEGPVHADWV